MSLTFLHAYFEIGRGVISLPESILILNIIVPVVFVLILDLVSIDIFRLFGIS